MTVPGQALLKRRQGTNTEAFKESYLRHGQLVIPWCLANNVLYYAQIHGPRWSSPEVEAQCPHVDLSDWDAAAEMLFDPNKPGPKFEESYYEEVILPDERRFLFDEATKHMEVVEAGSVVGERVEFIIDGKPVVDFEEWQGLWEKLDTAA